MNVLIIITSHLTRITETFNRELKLLATRQVGKGVIRGGEHKAQAKCIFKSWTEHFCWIIST